MRQRMGKGADFYYGEGGKEEGKGACQRRKKVGG